MLDTFGKEQRKCIKNIFRKFNVEPIYEDYNGDMIKHKIDDIDKIISILNKNPNKIYKCLLFYYNTFFTITN